MAAIAMVNVVTFRSGDWQVLASASVLYMRGGCGLSSLSIFANHKLHEPLWNKPKFVAILVVGSK